MLVVATGTSAVVHAISEENLILAANAEGNAENEWHSTNAKFPFLGRITPREGLVTDTYRTEM